MTRLFPVLFALTVFASGYPAAMAGKVTGKVVVSSKLHEQVAAKKKEAAKNTYYWNIENGVLPVRSQKINPAKDIAVVVFNADANDTEPFKMVSIKVHAGALERNVVATRPGSTIRFRNVDPMDHELYCPDMTNFEPERQSKGSYRPIRFENEGIFEVRCKLVPHFIGYVVVKKGVRVIPVNRDGTFSLSDLKAGKYTLKVFLDGEWIHKQSFKVTDDRRREVKLQVQLTPGKSRAKKATKK